MTISKTIFLFCLFFIGGIFVSPLFSNPPFLFLPLLFINFAFVVFRQWKKTIFFLFGFLFFFLGWWRYHSFFWKLEHSPLKRMLQQEIILVGAIDEMPKTKGKLVYLKIKPEKENFFILVKTNKYPQYQYGDELKIKGILKEAPIFEGFNYRNYLLKERVLAIVEFPEVEKIKEGEGFFLQKLLFRFKERFEQRAEELILPPEVGILEALIFGEEKNLSQEWKEKLNITGTRHITAVSGMNITILCYLILNFFLIFGFWRKQAILISLIFIFLYILLIGAPPSAIRAGIMGSLALVAQYFGRYSFGIRPIVFTGTIMLFQNPLLLHYDVGFQLSFLAILGLTYYQQIFSSLLKKIPNPKIFPARETLATTFSAQIFTLPLLIYNFGTVSLISPLTNLLFVPFLAPLTIVLFVFGLLALFHIQLAYLLSLFIYLPLHFIIKIIDFFSQLSFSHISLRVSSFWLFALYFLLSILTWQIQERQKLKFLG